jgi:hypothetical protein
MSLNLTTVGFSQQDEECEGEKNGKQASDETTKSPIHLLLSPFNRGGGRGGSLCAPGGVHSYKNATRATNGPLVGFVIRKMPLKATNGPKILSYEPYVS